MGFQTFTAGSVLTAAEVNDYLMRQAVIVCTSGTRPASPVEGMTIYETDTDKLLIYSGSSWIEGLNLTAWTSYTPTWGSSGVAPAIGNGTITGKYFRSGRLISFLAFLRAGSTTTFGTGSFTLTLPVAPHNSTARKSFTGFVFDDSASDIYEIRGHSTTATTINLYFPLSGTDGKLSGITGTGPITMANNDEISVSGTYESAT